MLHCLTSASLEVGMPTPTTMA